MRNLLIGFILLLTTFLQAQEPVKWSTSVEKISETEYNLIINAEIIEHWHLYAQNQPLGEEAAIIPTEFTFQNVGKDIELVGGIEEGEPVTEFDKIFEMELAYFANSATFKQRIRLINPETPSVIGLVQYQACDDERCIFRDADLGFSLDGNKVSFNKEVDGQSINLIENLELPIKNKDLLNYEQGDSSGQEKDLTSLFILGFLGGLIALLTPCVFPMIPLTVSFFTKQSGNKRKGISNAVLYGVFIIGIYMALSIPFHFLDSIAPEILNNISTNVWLNVIFFVIFIFFAFSFFGFYELTLPSSWGNKMDSASGSGGIVGIFFMALTLAIVSFSCTGPILGSLLAGSLSNDGGATQLTVGMTGFGVALALPFALFALFPNMLKSLPKSGGWMNTTKVILGFLELALAFKFLSNADMVEHWGILKREVFIGIWIVIFVAMALYVFGLIRFPHDGPKKKLSFYRAIFGIAIVCFIIYLVPGLQKSKESNLKMLSGFPPPVFYSIYPQESNCPLGLTCFKDFEEGLAYAQEHNKPILLDFTGWACVNCRKIEENVWSEPEIFSLLNENYVLISLYVDDRKNLSEDEQFNFKTENGRVKEIKTIGDKWATFQTINFRTASQPYYILMSPSFELLNPPQQYTDAVTYYEWLKSGLENYKEIK
ncbi:protein-disulfide reductase DsbD family protein [Galbibacter pacificus]|uniref:Thioredoxin family protein n=1 Tax=Galbibacter pacificus TaxID=2996052 RepID=A0ABT6FQ23_9FLAO|nr:cytochrome c biogenesis protein CcdA [Galbibacter pacificus]MDG3582161.1 cytochrome c biogenesis protein CcdA [Galbibacter pacificus]MDG3585363.1 thioredoxin family protein [Galbibacter pacificus]